MSDPALQQTFVGADEADFSLDVLVEDSKRPELVFMPMPDDVTEQNAAIIRSAFSTLRTLKRRKPNAPTVQLICEETAKLQEFPEISDWFAQDRGYGISPICVYQDYGQIRKNLGPNGATTLISNADLELYLGGGITDLDTAQKLSQRLGRQTLRLADPLVRIRAERAKREAIHAIMFENADPAKTGMMLRALNAEAHHTTKQGRDLRTPDEILNMPSDYMLAFATGYLPVPFALPKSRYYLRRDYAGRFHPNPYFDRDMDSVRLKTRFGFRRRKVVREPVPTEFAEFPQYRHGTWSYIEGYRPKLRKKGLFL